MSKTSKSKEEQENSGPGPIDLLKAPDTVEKAFEWCQHAGVSVRFTPHLVIMQLTGHPEVQATGAHFMDALEHLKAKAMPTGGEILELKGENHG